MKLKELAIDGISANRNLHLGKFGDGLSILYGENGSGKTSVREFVRGMLFGFDPVSQFTPEHPISAGWLNVDLGVEPLRLSRDVRLNSDLNAWSLGSTVGSNRTISAQQLAGNLNREMYDTIFNFSFRDTTTNASRLGSVLHQQLHVPSGPGAAGDETAHHNWQRESQAWRDRRDAIQTRMANLNQEKSGYESQIESSRLARQSQLAELETQLAAVIARINEIQASSVQEKISQLDQEIAQLRLLIDNAQTQVSYLPQPAPIDHHTSLYQRLDEMDNQIRRWRHVQSDIQNQRVRLRDEMLVWNELTLDSDEHPYHMARAILVTLESKVDEAERNANHWGDASGSRVDTSQMARTLGQICQSMRDDLYGLCNELAHQYKHIRHKAAAAELKQLRRCYTEMGENIDRLIRRRETVIREIRDVDPAGADAIVRADLKFCECAQHQGYLEACRRFVGHAPVQTVQPVYEVKAPNLDAERLRLSSLEQQRVEFVNTLAQLESEHKTLIARQSDLIRQRDNLSAELSFHDLNLKINNINVELATLHEELTVLLTRLNEKFVPPPANRLIQRACELLVQVSAGDLVQVFLGEPYGTNFGKTQIDIQVRDRLGKVLNFSAIEPSLQDQAYLCLILSAKEQLVLQQIETTTIIDDCFSRIAGDRVTPTLNVLNELGKRGHQLVALTQHRYLADRIPGLPVLELAPTMPTTAPLTEPERRSTVPPISPPFPESDWGERNRGDDPYFTSPAPRPYPLSKYARTNLNPADDFQRGYTVPYPLPPTSSARSAELNRASQADAFAGSLNTGWPAANVTPVSVNTFGDQLGYVSTLHESMRLGKIGIFDSSQLRVFADHGIETVGDLLSTDLHRSDSLGVHIDQLDRWQSQLWLLVTVPGMRINDARILVACGLTEPEHLDTSHPRQLSERIARFLATPEGGRFQSEREPISLDRINGWYRSLDATRSQWRDRNRFRRSDRPQAYARSSEPTPIWTEDRPMRSNESNPIPAARAYRPSHDRDYRSRDDREYRRESFDSQRNDRPEREQRGPQERGSQAPRGASERRAARDPRGTQESRSPGEPRVNREPRTARPPRMATPTPERKIVPRMAPATTQTSNKSARDKPKASASSNSKLKFYLDLSDHIEAAPSIGPKTAERFEKIGVVTVADFLKQTAESMATKIKYKRISAAVIRDWQHQARFVCRVPNLRGHDAQLLVACGVTEPEELATMQPSQLIDIIGPFSDTKEGLKIIRNGKKPDLAEITDWISWAEDTRSLQAA